MVQLKIAEAVLVDRLNTLAHGLTAASA